MIDEIRRTVSSTLRTSRGSAKKDSVSTLRASSRPWRSSTWPRVGLVSIAPSCWLLARAARSSCCAIWSCASRAPIASIQSTNPIHSHVVRRAESPIGRSMVLERRGIKHSNMLLNWRPGSVQIGFLSFICTFAVSRCSVFPAREGELPV